MTNEPQRTSAGRLILDIFLSERCISKHNINSFSLGSYHGCQQADRLRAVSLFSWSVEQNARHTQMTTRVTEGASAALARACTPLTVNLKKKRYCSQSSRQRFFMSGFRLRSALVASANLRSGPILAASMHAFSLTC